MTSYAAIIGDAGQKMIDDSFFNYSFRSKGTLTPTHQTAPGYLGAGYCSLTVSGEEPLVGIMSAALTSLYSRADNGDGTFTFTFVTADYTKTITYYVFDRPVAYAGAATARLTIRDANLRTVFDTTNKYMDIVDFATWTGSGGNVSASHGPFSYDSSKRYALVPLLQSSSVWTKSQVIPPSGYANTTLLYIGGVKSVVGSYDYGITSIFSSTVSSGSSNDGDLGSYDNAALIVDVTGF